MNNFLKKWLSWGSHGNPRSPFHLPLAKYRPLIYIVSKLFKYYDFLGSVLKIFKQNQELISYLPFDIPSHSSNPITPSTSLYDVMASPYLSFQPHGSLTIHNPIFFFTPKHLTSILEGCSTE